MIIVSESSHTKLNPYEITQYENDESVIVSTKAHVEWPQTERKVDIKRAVIITCSPPALPAGLFGSTFLMKIPDTF